MTVVRDAATVAELAPILRTGRLSRYRLLDICTDSGARVAQVLRTPAGLAVLARAPHWTQGASGWIAVLMTENDDVLRDPLEDDWFDVSTTDHMHTTVSVIAIARALAAGQRRVTLAALSGLRDLDDTPAAIALRPWAQR